METSFLPFGNMVLSWRAFSGQYAPAMVMALLAHLKSLCDHGGVSRLHSACDEDGPIVQQHNTIALLGCVTWWLFPACFICMNPTCSPSEMHAVLPSNCYSSTIWVVLASAWRETFTFHLGRKSIFSIILVLIIHRAKSKVNWFPEAEHTFGISTDTATVKEQAFQFGSTAVDVNKIAHEANCSQLLSALRTIMFFGNDHLC